MFSFQENNAMFSVTPVQNMFIEEILPKLTGDAVKVYLYGLKCCYYPPRNASMEAFAQTLGMEQSEVLKCLSLLEKNGVLRRVSDQPPKYIFFNQIYNAFTQSGTPEAALIRSNQAFINRVNTLFEGRQILREPEYTFLYDWIDTLGFSQDAVLLFLQHELKKVGPKKRISFAKLDKEIASWYQEGAVTLESAESYAKSLTQRYSGAERVLRIFNIRRAPDYGEEVLYEKWLHWGFSEDAIDYAAKSVDSAASPSLKYLDRILEDCCRNGILTVQDMHKTFTEQEEARTQTREILRVFGSVNRVSDELVSMYRQWREIGFSHSLILKAARFTVRRGQHSMQDLDRFLSLLSRMDVRDEASFETFRTEEAKVQALLQEMGSEQRPTLTDIDRYRALIRNGKTDEELTALAGKARGASVPMAYFLRLAQGSMEIPADKPARSGGKRVSGQDFSAQREYTEEELDSLIDDLSEWDTIIGQDE